MSANQVQDLLDGTHGEELLCDNDSNTDSDDDEDVSGNGDVHPISHTPQTAVNSGPTTTVSTEYVTEKNGTRSRISGAFYKIRKRSRDDWLSLLRTGSIATKRNGRKYFSDVEIKKCVQFIFRSDNTQNLSWGTRRVRCNGKYEKIPCVLRKMSIISLWRKYNNEPEDSYVVRKVGRTMFCDIVKTLTKTEVRQKACIDYILCALVYDNVEVCQNIIDGMVSDPEKGTKLQQQLQGVTEFLKYHYVTHLSNEENDPLHNSNFALLHSGGDEEKYAICKQCLSCFKCVDEVKEAIGGRDSEALQALDECKEKIKIYMGHVHRGIAQNRRISGVMKEVT